MEQYLNLVRHVLENGEEKSDRTGTGTISVFGTQSRYDLRQGFPILTTKKVLFSGVLRELLWFLKGSTNINDDLTQHTPIWDAWADDQGELGPIYGYQWIKWPSYQETEDGILTKGHINQIQNALDLIKTNPDSRRILVSAWNVADIHRMALPPCHLLFQFYVAPSGRLDCQLYQRSADIALGVPFNIASYALLLSMMAQTCNLTPGYFIHTIGDAHIYINHIEGLKEQLTRIPYALPRLKIAERPLFDLHYDDFELEGYKHHPFIKFKVSV